MESNEKKSKDSGGGGETKKSIENAALAGEPFYDTEIYDNKEKKAELYDTSIGTSLMEEEEYIAKEKEWQKKVAEAKRTIPDKEAEKVIILPLIN